MKVLVDSLYKDSGTNDDYTFVLAHPIKNVRQIRLVQSIFPDSIYNVDANYNTISMTDTTGSETNDVVLDSGAYSGTSLASELETQIKAVFTNQSWTCSYSQLTNKITTSNSTQTWNFNSSSNNTICSILGLNTTSSGNQTSYEHPNQIDLSFPRYLLMDLSCAGNTNNTDLFAKTSTTQDYHSFIIDMSKKDQYQINNNVELSDYLQIDNNNGFDVKTLSIKLHYPDRTITPEFNGINHQFLLELL